MVQRRAIKIAQSTCFAEVSNINYVRGLDVNEYLDGALYKLASDKKFELRKQGDIFEQSFKILDEALGESAFHRWDGAAFKGQFLMSNFEVLSTGVAKNLTSLKMMDPAKNAAQNIDALDFIRDGMDEIAKLRMPDVLRTANLKSEVFSDIARWLDIDITSFETHFKLIDESLVKKRNEIAHGEYVDLSGEDFGVLIKKIQAIMDGYKTALENAASLKAYMR